MSARTLDEVLSYCLRNPLTGCLEWQGARNRDGYGRIGWSEGGRKEVWLVHRYVWTLQHGPIPEGTVVMHSCDNPPCVEHLALGSIADNNRDMRSKDRYSKHRAKLTPGQVAEARRRHAAGGVTHEALATEYGVSRAAISLLLAGRTWS